VSSSRGGEWDTSIDAVLQFSIDLCLIKEVCGEEEGEVAASDTDAYEEVSDTEREGALDMLDPEVGVLAGGGFLTL
jgi:hypothetical protein